MGAPGSGKSSKMFDFDFELAKLGLHMDTFAVFDSDIIVTKFKNYRNSTRKIRGDFEGKQFNSSFYNSIGSVYNTVSHVSHTRGKSHKYTVRRAMDAAFNKLIHRKVNIL